MHCNMQRVKRRATRSIASYIPKRVDVRDVRQRLNMTQKEFAQFFGFSVYSIRNWEQGKRQPEGPARVLLTVIDREPEAVRRALVL